ncbi:uncharacterized protein At4g15545 isoform X2 [Asparagus officinalis]|uniref:uncharacterized protein At4g15545 isoform X2 n=1 Tax=Asparagus officinalis TaxID=4686 RepID=UPI00098E36E1|nr:uncharacterized protein At4g15545 isoform X2 [Asparagus officinalis]
MAKRDFELPESVLGVLPADPFEQLDVARKITSIALSSRVSALESEADSLRRNLAHKDDLVAELRAQVDGLDASLADLSRALAQADEEKAALLNENASLSSTVKKLNRDVSKLEVFKKTLMQSLKEEDDGSQGAPKMVPRQAADASFSTGSNIAEEEAANPSINSTSAQSRLSETGSSVSEDISSNDTDRMPYGLRISSLSTTPRFTPPGSPPRLTAALSPTKLSKPVSPRRHSIAIAGVRNVDGRSSMFSSMPPSPHSSMTSPFDSGSQTGQFLNVMMSRLSYEQFSAFLANVKELNSHKQTREETLRKAEEIFGADNKDLYVIFEGLITRNIH